MFFFSLYYALWLLQTTTANIVSHVFSFQLNEKPEDVQRKEFKILLQNKPQHNIEIINFH